MCFVTTNFDLVQLKIWVELLVPVGRRWPAPRAQFSYEADLKVQLFLKLWVGPMSQWVTSDHPHRELELLFDTPYVKLAIEIGCSSSKVHPITYCASSPNLVIFLWFGFLRIIHSVFIKPPFKIRNTFKKYSKSLKIFSNKITHSLKSI